MIFSINNKWNISKRLFDFSAAFIGLIMLSPVMIITAIAVGVTSPGPILFIQTRVGRHGRLFRCIKFRTMRSGTHSSGSITTATDVRITPVGRVLRNWKLDELPQLWNVLKGEMSFVGPRPDVPGYADQLKGTDRGVLELFPGITGPATLLFRDEEELLALMNDTKLFNDNVIYPEKLRINLEYLKKGSFWRDLGYIIATVAPFLTAKTGLDHRLGLDYGAFRQQMSERSLQYQGQADIKIPEEPL